MSDCIEFETCMSFDQIAKFCKRELDITSVADLIQCILEQYNYQDARWLILSTLSAKVKCGGKMLKLEEKLDLIEVKTDKKN